MCLLPIIISLIYRDDESMILFGKKFIHFRDGSAHANPLR